jgi:hypothetical protein
MGAIISLLVIVAISLIVVRIGTMALVMTGLPWDVASFQAYSAFFGVGFTTRESEMVVSDRNRRRIIKHLILAGNVGVTAGFGSVIVAFVKANGTEEELRVVLWIASGIAALWLLSITPPVRQSIDWMIKKSLRTVGVVRPADFALLLRLHAGFVVEEVHVHEGSPLVGRTLRDLNLSGEGVLVLGCSRAEPGRTREEGWVGTPSADFRFAVGDVLTVYGKQERIAAVGS